MDHNAAQEAQACSEDIEVLADGVPHSLVVATQRMLADMHQLALHHSAGTDTIDTIPARHTEEVQMQKTKGR